MAKPKGRLGRGLESLFADSSPIEEELEKDADKVETLKMTLIEPNKNQPRKQFDKEKIEALTESVREHGVIQPIIVVKNGDMYRIVAGERRWRAAKKAGLSEIPVVIRDYSDKEIAQISLIENLQRENLNPIEEALGYRALIDKYGMTQEEVSRTIGKSRSSIANSIRLLSLDENIRQRLISGEISSGHARALLSIEDGDIRRAVLESIISKGLNVRQAETLAKQLQNKRPARKKKELDEQVAETIGGIEHSLSERLGTRVKLQHGEKKGKIEIEYFGSADLERILSLLGEQ